MFFYPSLGSYQSQGQVMAKITELAKPSFSSLFFGLLHIPLLYHSPSFLVFFRIQTASQTQWAKFGSSIRIGHNLLLSPFFWTSHQVPPISSSFVFILPTASHYSLASSSSSESCQISQMVFLSLIDY